MHSSPRIRSRAGLTVIELVVTLGLLAVIAAFAIPRLLHRGAAGDTAKMENTLKAVQTALEKFGADSRAGTPHQLSALTTRPIADTTRLIDSSTMTATQISTWKGPYLGSAINPAASDSLSIGPAVYVMNFIDRYDAVTNVAEHSLAGGTNAGFVASNPLFAALQIHGLTPAEAESLNTSIDGASDASVAGGNATGRFRFSAPVGGTVNAYFLAVPIAR